MFREENMNHIGLYVFAVVVLVGFVGLILLKARWARQANRKWVAAKTTW
jgi:hypothetical protein